MLQFVHVHAQLGLTHNAVHASSYNGIVGCCFVQCEELYLQLLSVTFLLVLNVCVVINIGSNSHVALGWVESLHYVQGQEVLPMYNCSNWVGSNCGCGAGAIQFHTCLNFVLSGAWAHEYLMQQHWQD